MSSSPVLVTIHPSLLPTLDSPKHTADRFWFEMAKSLAKVPIEAFSRLVRPSSPSSSQGPQRLGDVDALGEETKDKQIQKVYKRRIVSDANGKKNTETDGAAVKGDGSKSNSAESPRFGIWDGSIDDGPPNMDPANLSEQQHQGQTVAMIVRVHHTRSMSHRLGFILLRQKTTTIQGVLEAGDEADGVSEEFVRWAMQLKPETIMRVQGQIRKAPERIQTCSIHDLELAISRLHVLVPVDRAISIDVYEMSKSEQDEVTGEIHLLASNRVRIANRIIFIRTPVAQSIMRIRSGICRIFRSTLDERGFLEIQTAKLQPAATESGAEVFRVDYFGRTAFLAQSPQLAKQMAVSSDLERVYEVGPVFRAENSNTHRHLTEFTGLDLEMALERDYYEAMDVIDTLLKAIFNDIYQRYRRELDEIQERFPHEDLVWLEETPRITFRDGVKFLSEAGWTNDDGQPQADDEDLGTKAEIRLGQIVKDKYKTDYYILDKFPTSARPFYTRLDENDNTVTNSFDIFVRGQEITTGGERIVESQQLMERMKDAHINPDSMDEYMQAFLNGAPRHAGCGIGLERLLYLLLGLDDIRNASMFPRDPKSFPTRDWSTDDDVPFPEADTVRFALGNDSGEDDGQRQLPDLGKLIANYGDATNTSWLDETYTVWRHQETGAAVGYAQHKGYTLIMGDPLCDPRHSPRVISAFLKDLLENDKKTHPIWLLVSSRIEELLGSRLGWRTLSVVAEQRLDVHNAKPLAKKERQAQNANIRIHETRLGELPPDNVRSACDGRIDDWKEGRRGTKQVHLTEVRPWIETDHRRYLWAADEEGAIQGLIVLHRLAPRYGYQIKFALDFPGSPSGCIEALISQSLKSLAASGVNDVTFGAGATEEIEFGSWLDHTVRAKIIRKTYSAVLRQLRLIAKSEFRDKFGAQNERVFICYPKLGLGVTGAQALINFFEGEM